MNNQDIYDYAFADELEKIAGIADAARVLVPGLLVGASVSGAAYASAPKQIKKEIRDPRLYSNLRGMATFESRKKRVAAHKKLGKGGTIASAMKQGFGRKKK